MKKQFHNKPVLIGVVVFCLLMALTQSFSYQKYLLNERDEQQMLSGAAYRAKNQLQNSLYQSLSATRILTFIVENYEVPKNFNAVAQDLIESNKYIDAIQLVKDNGVITHVYPLNGNEQALGYNILKDSARNKEAYKAIEKKELFFAGPFKLKQGGTAVVGRQPIFKDGKFFGFSAVIIKLPTLLKAAGIDNADGKFIYQLSKINPDTGKEEFFIDNNEVFEKEHSISMTLPNGEWNLYVKAKEHVSYLSIVPFIVLGIMFSLLGGVVIWYKVKEPEELNKRVEEKAYMLNRVEKRYRIIVENSLHALFLGKPDGSILEANKTACELFGYTQEEFRQIGRDGLIDHSQDVYNAIKERKVNRESQGELYGVKKNGEHILCEYSSIIFKDDNGDEFTSVMLKDISDRKRLEEQKQKLINEITESRNKFESLVQSIEGIFWESNVDTFEFTYISPQTKNLLGYEPEDWYGSPTFWQDHIYEDDKKKAVEYCHLKTLQGENHNFEYRMVASDGRIVWIRDIVTVVKHEDKPAWLRGLMMDITVQKKSEEEKLLALNINKIFNSEDTIERLLPQILTEILLYCRKKVAEIWVVNMDESELHLISQKSIDGSLIENNEILRFKSGEGLPGKVWKSKSEIFIEDLQLSKDFQRKNFALENKLVSGLGIPIIFKDKVIGVLVVYSETPNDTQDSFLKLSPSILTQLAFDIQRKKTETELNLMFNLSPDLICIAGMDGYFKKINPSFERLLGYTNEEILSTSYMDFIHPEDRQRTLEMLLNLFKGKTVLYYENRNVTKKGEVIWLSWTIAPLANEKLVFATAKDITERKKQEQQIFEKTEFIVDILESIGDAFFTVDKNFTVTYWNNVAETMLFTPRENVLGKNLWEVFPEAKTLPSYINYSKTINEHISSHFEDFYAPINKWFEISAYPSETGMSVYFKDITERKAADEKLLSLNYQLMEQTRELSISNAELEQFAYIASHDLQEPLRMITSFLTQLEKKYKDQLDEKANQYIFYAVDGAKRMREIILDLLEYSRVGKLDYKSELVDLNLLITEIQQIYYKQISEKNAVFEIEKLPTLKIFRTPVFQIFKNLIENALKYQPKDSAALIKISCKETETSWQFSVNDNGIGIDPEYFEKIFIIFQRLHNKSEYNGTGMGLAIVKKTVESMGGSIWVESSPKKGSTFYFTILKEVVSEV